MDIVGEHRAVGIGSRPTLLQTCESNVVHVHVVQATRRVELWAVLRYQQGVDQIPMLKAGGNSETITGLRDEYPRNRKRCHADDDSPKQLVAHVLVSLRRALKHYNSVVARRLSDEGIDDTFVLLLLNPTDRRSPPTEAQSSRANIGPGTSATKVKKESSNPRRDR